MNLRVLVLAIGCVTYLSALSDGEINTIKHLVDKELIKREGEILLKSRSNEIKLAGTKKQVKQTSPVTAKVKKTQALAEPSPPKQSHPDENLQGSIDNCIDLYDTDKCKLLILDGMDCTKGQMQQLCEKSCGFCGNFAVPGDCHKTQYGCCSDELTPKGDLTGTNCPKCEDNLPTLCVPHQSDCNEIGMVGNWMRANCKDTCGLCLPDELVSVLETVPTTQPCKDEESSCEHWKEMELCEAIPKFMKDHCRKSCNFCNSST